VKINANVPLPARLGIGKPAEAAEVDLELVAALAVGDPDRGAPPAPADIQLLKRVAVQRPLRHDKTPASEHLAGLADRQPVGLQPRLDPLVLGHEQPPRLAVTIGPVRADRLHHLATNRSSSCS
jgi:hypothetical protein